MLESPLLKLQASGLHFLLKRDSSTVKFYKLLRTPILYILHIFYRISANGCFWFLQAFNLDMLQDKRWRRNYPTPSPPLPSPPRSSCLVVFCKKSFIKIWQNSQENVCAGVPFLVELQVEDRNFIKKRLQDGFSCEICKILISYFTEHLRWLLPGHWRLELMKKEAEFTNKEFCAK